MYVARVAKPSKEMLTYKQTRTLIFMSKDEAELVELQEVLGLAGLRLLRQGEHQRAIAAAKVHNGGGLQSPGGAQTCRCWETYWSSSRRQVFCLR